MGRKNPSSAMWRILLGMDAAEDKGDNLPLVITLQIVPRNRKSTKTERDSGENGNVRGKSWHDCIQCLVPDIAMLFCLYNHSQQLEGMANGTSTYPRDPFQGEGNYCKKGVEGDRKGGVLDPPSHQRHQKKLSRSCREAIPSGNSIHEEHRDYCCPYTKT